VIQVLLRMVVFLEGYLEKRGGSKGGRRNWQRRFFVLTDEAITYFTPKGELKGSIPLVLVTEVKNSPIKSRENCFLIEYDCTDMDKNSKNGLREIPIDCIDTGTKNKWIKYVDTICKIYKLQKGNSMFTDYQNALAERTLHILKMAGALYSNNHEFLKRLVNDNAKREWNEAITPLIEPLFNTMDQFVGAARDGNFKSTEQMNQLLSPLEKMISGIISRWGRLNDKGHGNEVDKMSSNLEALESAVHRMENVVVKYINDTQTKMEEEALEKEKEKVKMEEIKIQQEKQQQEMKIQMEEQLKNAPPEPINPMDDPNLSDFEREIYKIKNQYGGDLDNMDEDDPNSNILNSLLVLKDLK